MHTHTLTLEFAITYVILGAIKNECGHRMKSKRSNDFYSIISTLLGHY